MVTCFPVLKIILKAFQIRIKPLKKIKSLLKSLLILKHKYLKCFVYRIHIAIFTTLDGLKFILFKTSSITLLIHLAIIKCAGSN